MSILIFFIVLCFPSISHSAGDVLMMKPQNIASAVDEFIELMKLNPDQKFTLEQNDEGTPKLQN